jgi:Leucine-rich repeat (LRR) protein
VQTIGANAFTYCLSAHTLNYNAEAIETLEKKIFNGIGTNIEKTIVNIGENVKILPSYIFYREPSNGYDNITQVNFLGDSKCTTIGDYAMLNCQNIESINLPESIVYIGGCAISCCYALKELTLGKNIRSIGERAFYGNSGLELLNYKIPNLTQFTVGIFGGVYGGIGAGGKFKIVFSKDVETIPESLFDYDGSRYYNAVKTIEFEENSKCISIGNYAFRKASSLSVLNLPESLTNLGVGAFANCTNLQTLNYNCENLSDFTSSTMPFYLAGSSGDG